MAKPAHARRTPLRALSIALCASLACTGGQTGTPTSGHCTQVTPAARADAAQLAMLAGSYQGALSDERARDAGDSPSHPVHVELRVLPDEFAPDSCGRATSVAATLSVHSEELDLDLALRGYLSKKADGAELSCDDGAEARCTLSLDGDLPAALVLEVGFTTLLAPELRRADR